MDPTLKNQVIQKMKREADAMTPRLRSAAKYILDSEADFGLDSIRETARKSGVSAYTLVRLARKLGFDGFDDLREPFRNALVTLPTKAADGAWLERWQAAGLSGPAGAASNAIGIVQRSVERQSPERLARVVDLLLGADTVYISAMRASYGLAYYFHYVARMALKSMQLVPSQMSSAVDELNDAQPGDVLLAITFTPYSQETIAAMRFAKKRGLHLILLSDSEIIAPSLQADETLLVSANSTYHFACNAGAMAVLEVLLAMLVERGGANAQARIAAYEALRQEQSAYWNQRKKL